MYDRKMPALAESGYDPISILSVSLEAAVMSGQAARLPDARR